MARRAFTDQDQSLAQRLLDKVRRTTSNNDGPDVLYNPQTIGALRSFLGHKSLNLSFMQSRLDTVDRLQKAVIELVKYRMQALNVQFPPLGTQNMSWCLPRDPKEEPAWRLLLEDPMQLNSEVLESLISLEEWTPDTTMPSGKSNFLYIRAFEIPASLLQEVLDDMFEAGFDTHEKMSYWLKRANEDIDENTVYTLRYCGQTTDSPWKRHSGDIYMSLQTFFGRFLKTLAQTARGTEVLRGAKVYTVSSALGQAATGTSDLREQILIALFGDGALNTQAGGKDVITIFREDRDNFDSLQTKTVQLLHALTDGPSQSQTNDLEGYARSIYKYVTKTPSTTGSSEFTEETAAMIHRQATPAVLPNGSAVMVTIGSDLGEEHESREETFWTAEGRSSDAVNRIYNFFCSWEGPTALESVDLNATKNLALQGYLPFVDLFPWFKKDDKDYLKASELLRRYMNIVKPMIVLAYGERPIFAVVHSFKDFTSNDFNSWARMRYSYGRMEQNGHPYLSYFDGSDSNDHQQDKAVVIIPSLHPGFLSRAGIVKEKATRLFVMTSAVAWCAMSAALTIARDGAPANREVYAKAIITIVETATGPMTKFGKAMQMARKEYEDCHQAYGEGQARRRKAPDLAVPRGILPTKSIRAKRKARYTTLVDLPADGVGGWEVSISKDPISERSLDFYTMTWKEDGGKIYHCGPLPLTKDVIPAKNTDKRFIFYVAQGLDIRGADGQSLGLRSPLASGNSKKITLPISCILVSLALKSLDIANDFLEHWEEVTGMLFVDEIMVAHSRITVDMSEAYLPSSFFAQGTSRSSLPFPPASLLTASTTPKMLAKVRPGLPANPSDILWLIEQFLLEEFPNGGDIDPVSVSEHPTYSVFGKLMTFASRTKYQHHPHINTLKAMAHLSEQGSDDRRIALNMLLLALEILRPGYSSKNKQLGRTLPDGSKIRTSRVVRTFGGGPAASTSLNAVNLPELVASVDELGEVEDFTDYEDLEENTEESEGEIDFDDGGASSGQKRKRPDDKDDDQGDRKDWDPLEHKRQFGVRRTKAIQ